MQITYYDIGLNLFCRQFPDPEKVIREAWEQNVCCILTGTDRKENQKIDAFVKTHDAYGTAGIHPHNADRARQEDFQHMERILSENGKIVAVGECGLDYDRMFSTKENQIRCLEKHIVLAEKLENRCFFMSAVHLRISSEGLSGIRISAKGLWYTVLQETKKCWNSIFPWDFPSVSPDGSATTAGRRNCGKRYR